MRWLWKWPAARSGGGGQGGLGCLCFFFSVVEAKAKTTSARAWDVPAETPSSVLSTCPFLAVVISVGQSVFPYQRTNRCDIWISECWDWFPSECFEVNLAVLSPHL